MSFKEIKSKYKFIFKETINGFGNDRVHKLSASMAYTTIFSIAPMLLLIIIIGGTFYGNDALKGKVFEDLKDIIGADTASYIQELILKINFQQGTRFATVVSSIVLLIAATGLFVEIQDSLNMIWGVRPKKKKGVLKFLLARLVSFITIILFGIFLVLILIINTVLIAVSSKILDLLPDLNMNAINWINTIFFFFAMSLFFAMIYKWLPDVAIKWKDVWQGSFLTALLFVISKWGITLYISNNNTVSLYGAAGSVIILLLWIYLSAFIFYFGAEFIHATAKYKEREINPTKYAEHSDKLLYRKLKEKHDSLEQDFLELKQKIENSEPDAAG